MYILPAILPREGALDKVEGAAGPNWNGDFIIVGDARKVGVVHGPLADTVSTETLCSHERLSDAILVAEFAAKSNNIIGVVEKIGSFFTVIAAPVWNCGFSFALVAEVASSSNNLV